MVLYDSAAITDAAFAGNVNIRCTLTRSLTVPDGLRAVTTLTFADTTVPASVSRVVINDTVHSVFDGFIAQNNLLRITGEVAGVGAATDDIIARVGSIKWNALGN